MSQDAKPTRPGQATFAVGLIIGGSVILVLTAWQRVSTLHTLEVQEELQRLLTEPPLAGSGLTLGALSGTVRVLCMVAAGSATAAAILGVQALRRSTSARGALTVLAPLVLVGGFATAGFFAPLVVAGVVMLWLSPTRDWFAGRSWSTPTPREKTRPDPFAQHEQPPVQLPTHSPPDSRQAQPAPAGQVFGAPFAQQPSGQASYDVAQRRRPPALIWACAVTVTLCGLLSALMVLFSLVFAFAPDEMFAEIARQQPDFDFQGLSHEQVINGVYAMTGFVVLWSIAAIVFAIVAFRGAGWGRIALLVSAVAAGVACLALSVANPLLLLVVAACGATSWLLLRPDVTAWFRR